MIIVPATQEWDDDVRTPYIGAMVLYCKKDVTDGGISNPPELHPAIVIASRPVGKGAYQIDALVYDTELSNWIRVFNLEQPARATADLPGYMVFWQWADFAEKGSK